jgi:hypothetical protein
MHPEAILSLNTSLHPIHGLIVSILLILGISFVGFFVARKAKLYKESIYFPLWQQWLISPILGTTLISPFLFPIILFGSHAKIALLSLAYCLLVIGIALLLFSVAYLLLNWRTFDFHKTFKSQNLTEPLLFLILIAYGLISLSPPTDIDALDYHIGVPLNLLTYGTWTSSPEWFTSRLAGLGEVFIALGLSVGAEQFGSLIQYCGILSIVACISRPLQNEKNNSRLYLTLCYIASPVLLWLVSTSKPLLLPIGMTTVALFFLGHIHSNSNPKLTKEVQNSNLRIFLFAFLLISCASLMKLNFLLSAAIIGIIILKQMYECRMPKITFFFGITTVLLVLAPPAIFKSTHFGGNWIAAIYNPLPGDWSGSDNFINYLRSYSESNLPFPISVITTTDPGQITTVIGIGALVGIYLLISGIIKTSKPSFSLTILVASGILICLGSVLGQTGGRFYMEPLAWIFLAIRLSNLPLGEHPPKILLLAIWAQSLIVAIGAILLTWLLFRGSLSSGNRVEVLTKNACQYSEMQWANMTLPQSAILLTEFRNKSFSNFPIVSLDWSYYLTPQFRSPTLENLLSVEASPYLTIIKNRKATHILLAEDPINSPWKGCFGNSLGTFDTQFAARNPFNSGRPYTVWLLEFNSQNLPSCLLNKN